MTETAKRLDRGDLAILRVLQRHGRATNAELSQVAHLSESACLRRVKAMEAAGVIDDYAARVDQRSVGLPLNAYVTIALSSQADIALAAFEDAIAKLPEVMECFLMTGSSDYLLRVVARNVDDLERIHATRLTRLPGVARVTSSIAMRQVVRRAELPIGDL